MHFKCSSVEQHTEKLHRQLGSKIIAATWEGETDAWCHWLIQGCCRSFLWDMAVWSQHRIPAWSRDHTDSPLLRGLCALVQPSSLQRPFPHDFQIQTHKLCFNQEQRVHIPILHVLICHSSGNWNMICYRALSLNHNCLQTHSIRNCRLACPPLCGPKPYKLKCL